MVRIVREVTKKSKPSNPDDEWLQYATVEVAGSMLDWLKNTVNTKRAICTLTKEELSALAGNAIGQYEVTRSRRSETQRPYDPPVMLGG